jgi:hypothetical protein
MEDGSARLASTPNKAARIPKSATILLDLAMT